MEQIMSHTTTQQGSAPAPQGQQSGQSQTTPQQTAGTQPAPEPVIRDWAAF
jgi:hypothetical protein